MYLPIIDVKSEKNYSIEVKFSNGQIRSLDMRPYLDKGVFKRLKNERIFKTVHVSFDTVEWDCGIDLDPEFVFEKSRPLLGAESSNK